MKKWILAISLGLATSLTLPVNAEPVASVNDLLRQVKQGRSLDAKENRQREATFKANKKDQQKLLGQAEAERKAEEKRSVELEQAFEANELIIVAKQEQLENRLGSLKELFGHITASAGDLRTNMHTSLVSAQYQDRDVFLSGLIDKMSSSSKLPSLEEIERLWFELHREMTESGKIVKFDATVIQPNGEQSVQPVVRVGTYNLVSDGQYLTFVADGSKIEVLARQPKAEYLSGAAALEQASSGLVQVGIDPTGPTGGSYLKALINTPDLEERWRQGREVGYMITGLGGIALLIALWRFLALLITGMKVKSQLKSSEAKTNNPLGRVLKVHQDNPSMDIETLELKLGEAILRERPRIELFIPSLKIIAMIAPLMGLLGTVTGMIVTFQAITIFGAGDPKAMAGGISGALVTTVLGLVVAIPTVLLHTIVNGRARTILQILEEQSVGMVAEHAEKLKESSPQGAA